MLLIVRKEILTVLRGIRIQIVGSVLVALMLAAVLVGQQGQKLVQKECSEAQVAMHDKWVSQVEKHPHSVTHYGQFAFKPKPVLSFLDMGIDQFSGTSVFLKAHKQNEILYSAAQDSKGMTRFGELTAGFILPLLIISLFHNFYALEKESETWSLLKAKAFTLKLILLSKLLRLMIVWGIFALLILLGFIIQGISVSQHVNLFSQWHFVIFGYALLCIVTIACVVAFCPVRKEDNCLPIFILD